VKHSKTRGKKYWVRRMKRRRELEEKQKVKA
jgi:hypothetical protein